jgi:hypothetical protein
MIRRRGLAAIVALAFLLSARLVAQDVAKARQLLEQALAALTPPPAVVAIATPAALDQALAAIAPGAVLQLDPVLVYDAPLTIRQSVTLQSIPPAGRMTRGPPLPSFRRGLTIAADHVTLIGLEVRQTNPLTDILIVVGAHATLDRVRVLGDPVKGGKRGIAANSNGDLKILRSYVADIFGPYPGQDTQAICGWDMGPGLLIEENYLEGSHETLLIGGADPTSEARTPADVTIRGNTITKNPAWQGVPIGVKNTLELKNVKGAIVEDNDISQSWGGRGQDGYLLVVTIRNQDGRAPWSTVQDVTIRRNHFSHGAAAINLLGLDTIKETGAGRVVPVGTVRPSVRMARVTIAANTFTDLDPKKFTGSNKLILIDQAPEDLTIEDNAFDGVGFSSAIYFGGGGPALRLVVTNNRIPKTTYGIFGAGVTAKPHNFTATNPAWVKYTSGGTIATITEAP